MGVHSPCWLCLALLTSTRSSYEANIANALRLRQHMSFDQGRYDKASPYMVSKECACARRPGLQQSCRSRELACRPCNQDAAVASPMIHTCGCTRPSCACFGHKRTTLAAKHVCVLKHKATLTGFKAAAHEYKHVVPQ